VSTPNDLSEPARRSGPGRALLYYAIYVLLLPVVLAGYAVWVGKLYAGRRSGVSATAQGPLSARWFQHELGIRRDVAAHRLLMVLPGVSPLAVRLVFGPMRFASRISGYVPPTFRYPFDGEITLRNQASARQTVYDDVVDRYLPGIAQFIILGAGFDTRALRLPSDAHVRSFEVDTPATVNLKQEALKKADVDPAGVTFVAADFEQEDWFDLLVEAGFNPAERALFLWEGVTPYLDRNAVEDTLGRIAGTAAGSVIAFDYFSTEVLESRSPIMRIVRRSLQKGGEPLKFGVDSAPPLRERVSELVRSCGLALVEQRTVGEETGERRAWGGFAVAVVESSPLGGVCDPAFGGRTRHRRPGNSHRVGDLLGAGRRRKPSQDAPHSDGAGSRLTSARTPVSPVASVHAGNRQPTVVVARW
jgi:methyltransferase (TIGR00027 family)